MKKNKYIITIIIIIIVILSIIFVIHRNKKYSIDAPLKKYNILNTNAEDSYIDYLKNYIKPLKLRPFIKNNFVPTVLLSDEDTGYDMLNLMTFAGYDLLFKSFFDKSRTNFDDCPVTDNFKNKFNTNLLYYYNLNESDDCEVNCSHDDEEKTIKVEVYGNFENTEPTYWNTHLFTYTLDDDGNVDDVILDNQ